MVAPPSTPVIIATVGFLLACVVTDVKALRIPNYLTFPAAAVGLALNSWAGGWWGFLASLAGFALAAGLLIAPFALGGIGAGDVKMMAAVGSLLGPQLLLLCLLAGTLAGGIVAASALARRGLLLEKLANTWTMASSAVLTGSLTPLRVSASAPGAVIFPYSVPLALGTLVVITVARIG